MKRFIFLIRPHLDLNRDGMQWSTATVVAKNQTDARAKLEAEGLDVGAMWSDEPAIADDALNHGREYVPCHLTETG